MLSQKERHECYQILALLTDDDVLTLARTSTNNAIKVDSRSEAENAILAYTDVAEDLLNRKKINKGILLKYCLDTFIPVSGNDSKAQIVSCIISHWAWKCSQKTSAVTGYREPSASPAFGQWQNRNESSSSYKAAPVIQSGNQSVTVIQNVFNVGSIRETHNQTLNMAAIPSPGNADQASAEAFVKWFYEMLNAYHPAMNRAGDNFGPHHFWDDAQLFLLMASSAERDEENVVGSGQIVERLLAFPKSNHILFNPNVNSQGVTLRSSHHGSKLILVCGTLHTPGQCFGIFQQSFALVSNPFSPENWKVKITCLKMDKCPASNLPRLEDCKEIQAIEAHTNRALQQSNTGSTLGRLTIN